MPHPRHRRNSGQRQGGSHHDYLADQPDDRRGGGLALLCAGRGALPAHRAHALGADAGHRLLSGGRRPVRAVFAGHGLALPRYAGGGVAAARAARWARGGGQPAGAAVDHRGCVLRHGSRALFPVLGIEHPAGLCPALSGWRDSRGAGGGDALRLAHAGRRFPTVAGHRDPDRGGAGRGPRI